MKVKDLINRLRKLDSDTEILIGNSSDYSWYLNSTIEVETDVIDMSDDFRNHACRKVLFLE